MRRLAFFFALIVAGTNILFAESNDGRPSPTIIEKILGAKGQGIALPDISLIVNAVGSLNGQVFTNAKGKPDLYGKGDFKIDEVELVIQGYLYPSIRADFTLSVHDKEAEIEEAYVSFLGIWDGLSAKLGQERIDFGRLNKQHPHTWSFVSTPTVVANFLGELKGAGATVSYLLPLPFFLNVDVSGWKLPEPDAFGLRNFLGTAKLLSSFPLGNKAELQIGGSGAIGQGPESTNAVDNLKIASADLTLKIFPSSHSRIVFQNEGYGLFRESTILSASNYSRFGFYSFLGVKPVQEWEFGLRYDLSQGTEEADASYYGKGTVFGTWWLTEATSLRLEYSYEFQRLIHNLAFQFVFGLGPHTHPIK